MRLASCLSALFALFLLAAPVTAEEAKPLGTVTAEAKTKASANVIMFTSVSILDYDEALTWYTDVLGLRKHMDETLDPATGTRWLTVCVQNEDWPQIALWRVDELPPSSDAQQFILLGTDNIKDLTEQVREGGGAILQEPTQQPWAIEAIITDPWGNLIILNEYDMSMMAPEGE